MVVVTEQQLNRSTLARQLLLERGQVGVGDAVRRVVGIQAQEPAGIYLSLWNRVAGFDPVALDAAISGNEVVRALLVRITLHVVHRDDYTAFHAAMVHNLRASRLGDRRFTDAGFTKRDADGVLDEFLAYVAVPRARGEIGSFLSDRFDRPVDRLWWALRTFAPIVHVPAAGPWSFVSGGPMQAASIDPEPPTPEAALGYLFRRYLEGFGPATAQDFGLFALQRRPSWQAAIAHLGDELVVREGPGGVRLYDVADGVIADGDTPSPPRLLPMWDNILLAHVDRSRVIPHEYRPHVIHRNGDTLPTLLVDGRVAGIWRPAPDGTIEATAFHRLPRGTWAELEAEAADLLRLLADRDPTPYARFGHWWDKLTLNAAEIRRIGR